MGRGQVYDFELTAAYEIVLTAGAKPETPRPAQRLPREAQVQGPGCLNLRDRRQLKCPDKEQDWQIKRKSLPQINQTQSLYIVVNFYTLEMAFRTDTVKVHVKFLCFQHQIYFRDLFTTQNKKAMTELKLEKQLALFIFNVLLIVVIMALVFIYLQVFLIIKFIEK